MQLLKECLRTKSVLQEHDNFGIVELLNYSTCGEFQSFFNQSKASSIRSQILRVSWLKFLRVLDFGVFFKKM